MKNEVLVGEHSAINGSIFRCISNFFVPRLVYKHGVTEK